jgi:hypothetical protein
MTYSAGNVILAADYNGFANDSANNIGNIWAVGSTDKGWGQSNIANVAAAGTVTATQWATLVNTLTTMGQQCNVAITSRTAPTAGNTIAIFANVATDINNLTLYRGNAAASGTTSSTWTGNIAKVATTATNAAGWNITFTNTTTFANATSARYFWNAGGLIRIDMSKTSTGTDKDADWNTFVGTAGTLYMSGRVNGAAQTIAGTSYTGFTRSGGSGTPSPNLTTTGWYTLTAGAAATTMWQLNDTVSPYSGDYIQVTAAKNAGATTLTFVTTWHDNGYTLPGENNAISGGTDTASPYTSFGTAPAVLVRYIPPSSTYLTTASWGTPTIAASVA